MALMLSKLYTALREANVPEDKAAAAAEEVAGFENRLANVEARLSLLTWMVGFQLALTVVILGKLFVH
jgi:hypothetical protein